MVSTFLTTWVLRERLQLASSTIQGRSTSGLGHKNIAAVIKQGTLQFNDWDMCCPG